MLCTVLVFYHTIFQMPLLEVLIRAIFTVPSASEASQVQVFVTFFSKLQLKNRLLNQIQRIFGIFSLQYLFNLPDSKRQTLKIEIEYEFALFVLTTIIENSSNETFSNQQAQGQLLDIIISHIENCDDELCICSEIENFFELMKYKEFENKEVVSLVLEDRKKYKKIIDEQGLIGSVSNFTQLVNQKSNQVSTHLQMLNEIDILSKKDQSEDKLNKAFQRNENDEGEYFIKIDKLNKRFSYLSDLLCTGMMTFWKEIEKTDVEMDLLLKMSDKIAENIRETHQIFKQIEQTAIMKDYQIYFQYAVIQLHVFNDIYMYETYIGKMKSLIEYAKMFERNDKSDFKTEYQNYLIVDANGQKFGQVIQMNKNFMTFLDYEFKEERSFKIDDMMPTLICEKHNLFLDRYNKTGQSLVLNQKICLFFKKRSGYVVPAEVLIKFHYSAEHQYIFLSMVKPIYEMKPFNSSSENIRKKVDNVLVDLNFQQFKHGRKPRYIGGILYEDIHMLEMVELIEDNENIRSSFFLRDQEIRFKVKTRIFEERYCGGALDINIFCMVIMDETMEDFSQIPSLLKIKANHEKSRFGKTIISSEQQLKQSYEDNPQEDNESIASSMNSTNTSQVEYKSMNYLTSQKTPRSLKIMFQLAFVLYLVLLVIPSISLGINILRQSQSELDIHVVQLACQRLNQVSKQVLYARSLLNMQNNKALQMTSIYPNRFENLKQIQSIYIDELRGTQSEIQNSRFQKSSQFMKYIEEESVQLYFLNSLNNYFMKREKVDLAINLYIARLSEFNQMNQSQYQGNLSIFTLNPNNSLNYRPTQDEQSIYFLIENGIKGILSSVGITINYFVKDAEDHSKQNISSTEIVTIVSIITIMVVGIIFTPIFSKSEIRRYLAIKFFLNLDQFVVQQMKRNVDHCQTILDEKKQNHVSQEYQKFMKEIKSIKIESDFHKGKSQNQDHNKLVVPREQLQFKMMTNYMINNTFLEQQQIQDYEKQKLRLTLGKNRNYNIDFKDLSEMQSDSLISMNSSLFGGQKLLAAEQGRKNTQQTKDINIFQADNHNQQDNIKKQFRPSNVDQTYTPQYTSAPNIGNSAPNIFISRVQSELNQQSLSDSSLSQSIVSSQYYKSIVLPESKNLEETHNKQILPTVTAQEIKSNEIDKKMLKILMKVKRSKLLMFATSIFIILILSGYFVITFFMAINTFDTSAEVNGKLKAIFQRGSCLDITINFYRETLIRQELIQFEGVNYTSGIDFMFDKCQLQEKEYNRLRVDDLSYLAFALPILNKIESKEFCDYVFKDTYKQQNQLCKTSLKGIFKKGFSNGINYIYNTLFKNTIQIKAALLQKDKETIIQMMKDPFVVEIIDINYLVLDPAFKMIQDSTRDSVLKHIQKLLSNFIVAFVVFISMLTLSLLVLIFYGFKRLRHSMSNTNIILRVIPYEAISKDERDEIRNFFDQ
ncbi:UNKNOWN [Stylonychia lemnae]|uniref:Pas domain s-box family protein n=1 Tax=Stylonychia lemnae TaxID=5949 RepID=A0A078A922_STYLE|nr:UNKNOWN [Stylonychia lemnae]|eukprot:CDW78770.1 UNKNOWN [Stylonychia lemnae]